MVVADAVLDEVVQHLLGQRLAARDARRRTLHPHAHALVVREAGQPPGHALRHRVQVNGRRTVVLEGRLVKLRQRQHVVDQRAHGLRLVVDERGELLAVGGLHHVVLHELGVARYHLQGRLHLMAHVAGEIAAHVLGFGQLAVLLLELALLLVDPDEQRVHLLVYLIVQRVREIERVDGLHDPARKYLRQQEHERHRHDERYEHGHEHLAEER